jgi:diguanylate cyclase (GGDEF)-like protein/PAS domain S-box-containing protein
MSLTLETFEGRPDGRQALATNGTEEQDLELDDGTRIYYQAALEMVAESIVFISAMTSRLIDANRAAANRLGYSRKQLRNVPLLQIAPHATSANLTGIFRRALGSANQATRARTIYRQRSGELIPVRCSIRALRMPPDSILVVVAQDASERGGTDARLTSAAFRDSLTLLPNREWLWRQLERRAQAARKSGDHFAVLFIDIDRFKDINDSYGHLAGDQVLQAVARRLTASVRPDDCVARYGGDEFVVVMRNVEGKEEIRRIVERIGRRIDAVIKRRGENDWRARVTVSIGVAISGGKSSSSLDAIERADQAMYRAKALGRNGRFVMDESARTPVNRRQAARSFLIGPDRWNEFD